MNVNNVCVPLYCGGTLALGTANALAFMVPTDAIGGGITITAVGVQSRAAIAAGSAPLFTLVSLGTNSAINGTIASVAEGAFTAGTVKALTISTAFVDAGYGVAFKCAGTVVSADQMFINGFIQYVMGK